MQSTASRHPIGHRKGAQYYPNDEEARSYRFTAAHVGRDDAEDLLVR